MALNMESAGCDGETDDTPGAACLQDRRACPRIPLVRGVPICHGTMARMTRGAGRAGFESAQARGRRGCDSSVLFALAWSRAWVQMYWSSVAACRDWSPRS